MLARVFEPWVTTKTVGKGTGLGLAIAREVIDAHGGMIEIRNVEGAGAIVTIDLPRAVASSSTDVRPNAPVPDDSEQGNRAKRHPA